MSFSTQCNTTHRVLRVRQACQVAQISAATFWRRVKNDPLFPKPFPLGMNARAVGIDADEFDTWLAQCKARRGV